MSNFLKHIISDDCLPSVFLRELQLSGQLNRHPELLSLIVTPQDPLWHPEGNVWEHTLLVVDVAYELRQNLETQDERIAFMLGALCHDLGKPYTTQWIDGHFRSRGHDSMGVYPAYTFLKRIDALDYFDSVAKYIIEHLKPTHFYKTRENISDRAIVRLAERIDLNKLILLCKADHWGRTDQEAHDRYFPHGAWLLERYNSIIQKPKDNKPLLKGRYIIRNGITDGKLIGIIIRECLELQNQGVIQNTNQAEKWFLAKFI